MQNLRTWIASRPAHWHIAAYSIAVGIVAAYVAGAFVRLSGLVHVDAIDAAGYGFFVGALMTAVARYLKEQWERVSENGGFRVPILRDEAQQPTLANYGLSAQDVRLIERRYQRFASWLTFGGCAIGAVTLGWLLGADGDTRGMLGGGLLGYVVGGVVALNLVESIVAFVRKRDAQHRRYEQYQAAVAAFGARVREAEAKAKEAEERERRRQAEFWYSLSGHQFERELAALFECAGYTVQRTPGSGDGGIDIVLRRAGKTTIVQCKQNKNPVAPAVARELYGALVASEADDAILAVTGAVSVGVNEFFVGKPLRVMDLNEIIRLHGAFMRQGTAETA